MTRATDLVTRRSGTAAELHSLTVEPDSPRALWWLDASRPALVLGSRQTAAVLDADAVAAEGLDVVVRRSGGGAVLVVPGDLLWVDVVLPVGDPLWRDDVSEAMVVVGERWLEALDGVVDGDLQVHRGRLERSAWSELVCFDGLGPGEVLVEGAKLVGISQRRTRTTARFQCAVHLRHDPDRLVRCLRGPLPAEPHRAVATIALDGDPGVLVDRLAAAFG